MEEPTLDLFPLVARVRSYAMTPLEFDPDSKYQYSKAGINTAARIIEVVAGMPFERFLDERLFRPLGMKDTTFWPSEEQVARIAKSYKPGPAGQGLEETTIGQVYYPLTDRTQRFPMPAGGLFSTAADMARFYQMLLNGGQLNGKQYLSESAVKQQTSRQTPPDLPQSYFYGDYYPLTTYSLDQTVWTAWQFDRPDLGEGMVPVFRRAESPYRSAVFPLRGLEADATYRVIDLDTGEGGQDPGRQLMQDRWRAVSTRPKLIRLRLHLRAARYTQPQRRRIPRRFNDKTTYPTHAAEDTRLQAR